MTYKFYRNNKSINKEVHICKIDDWRRSEKVLCNDSRVELGDSAGMFIGENSAIVDFDENNARDFAKTLQNNNYNVCGKCIATLYLTRPDKFQF